MVTFNFRYKHLIKLKFDFSRVNDQILKYIYQNIRLSYWISLDCFLDDLLTFPTLSDLCFFSGITYWLTKGQGEFLTFQQYNLGTREGRGRVEG